MPPKCYLSVHPFWRGQISGPHPGLCAMSEDLSPRTLKEVTGPEINITHVKLGYSFWGLKYNPVGQHTQLKTVSVVLGAGPEELLTWCMTESHVCSSRVLRQGGTGRQACFVLPRSLQQPLQRTTYGRCL